MTDKAAKQPDKRKTFEEEFYFHKGKEWTINRSLETWCAYLHRENGRVSNEALYFGISQNQEKLFYSAVMDAAVIGMLLSYSLGGDPVNAVYFERERQKNKWGVQRHHALKWCLILSEECGEVAKAILENRDTKEIIKEATHAAAVAVQIVEWYLWIERVRECKAMIIDCEQRERRFLAVALESAREDDAENTHLAMAGRAENNRFLARLRADLLQLQA